MSERGPSALGQMPSTEAVLSILRRLERRHFSRDVYARLLDADVTGEVLTVVAWQGVLPRRTRSG